LENAQKELQALRNKVMALEKALKEK